jgi:hypothetical protein
MIYIISAYERPALMWLDGRGLDPSDACIITKIEDTRGCRAGGKDQIVNLGGDHAEESIFILTCHRGSIER